MTSCNFEAYSGHQNVWHTLGVIVVYHAKLSIQTMIQFFA